MYDPISGGVENEQENKLAYFRSHRPQYGIPLATTEQRPGAGKMADAGHFDYIPYLPGGGTDLTTRALAEESGQGTKSQYFRDQPAWRERFGGNTCRVEQAT